MIGRRPKIKHSRVNLARKKQSVLLGLARLVEQNGVLVERIKATLSGLGDPRVIIAHGLAFKLDRHSRGTDLVTFTVRRGCEVDAAGEDEPAGGYDAARARDQRLDVVVA